MPSVNQTAFRIATLSAFALFVLCLVWELSAVPEHVDGTWLWLKAVPILAVLPGLVRAKLKTLQAGLLLSMLYLMESLVRIFDPWPVRAFAIAEGILVSIFFVAAVAVLYPLKKSAQHRKTHAGTFNQPH